MSDQSEKSISLHTSRQIVDEILAKHKGNNLAQCQKCGSINSDAWELLKTFDILKHDEISCEDEDCQKEYESCNSLLEQILDISFPEDCWDESYTLTEWIKENEKKYLTKPSIEYGFEAIIKFQNIILKTDNKCDCFRGDLVSLNQSSVVPVSVKGSKKKVSTALSAQIRSKLQTATAALELIKAGKKVPKDFIEIALKDLEKVKEIIKG